MAENYEDAHESIPNNRFPVWFAKVLCFMRLLKIARKCKVSGRQRSNDKNWGSSFDGPEYWFAQYVWKLSNSKLKIDWMDTIF